MKQDKNNAKSLPHSQSEKETSQAEEQENFSAAFLFQVFESVSEPIFVKNRQHEWVLLNDACYKFFGLNCEQIIGKSDYDLFTEEKANLLWEKDELVFSSGLTNESEELIITNDGKKYFVSIKKCLFRDRENNQFLLTQIRDITQKVQAYKEIEVQLQESKQLLELVIDSIPQAIFWKDCNSVYQGCNNFFAQIAGIDIKENIVGKTDYDLSWNDRDIKWLRESDRRVIESGIGEYVTTYKPLQADDRPCWLEISRVLLKNDRNDIVGILGTFQDVTERKELEVTLAHLYEELEVRVKERTSKLKKAVRTLRQEVQERQKVEKQLRESQDLLRMVINNIPQLIFWKDLNSVYLGCNTNFAKFAGLNTPEEIVGKTDYDLTLSKKQVELDNELHLMELGESLLHQIEVRQLETGEKAWIDTSKIPLHNQDGDVVGILGSYEDITKRKQIEEVLQQTEEKFGRISKNLPGMLYQFKMDSGGKLSFPYVSSSCYYLFGFTPNEVQADAGLLVSAIHRDEQKKFADSIATSAQSLQPWQWEGRIVHKNGQIKWIQANSRPERQMDASIIWDGIVIDISRRKQTERTLERAYAELEQRVEERTQQLAQSNIALQIEITERQKIEENLRISRHRLARLIAQTPLAVIEWDLSICIQEWNPAAEKIFGFTKDEVLGRHLEYLVPEKIKEEVRQITPDLLAQKGTNRIITENITKDGSFIFCEWYNNPLINTDGQLIGVASMVVDITERKQAEVILKESEAKFRTLVNNNPGAIYRCLPDLNNTILFISNVIEEISGYSVSDFINSKVNKFHSIIHSDDLQKVKNTINQAVSQRQSYALEYRIINAKGNIRWVYEKGQAIYNKDNDPIYIDGGIFDISEHKAALHKRQEAEEALRLSGNQLREKARELEITLHELQCTQIQLIQSEQKSSLGQLVTGVAHKLSNPVNFIDGNLTCIDNYTQNLLKILKLYERKYPTYDKGLKTLRDDINLEFVIKDLPQKIDSMQLGVQRIKKIVTSLRNFSHLDEAPMKKVDINEGIEATLMIIQYNFKAQFNLSSIEIIKSYADLPLIECYAGQLSQVFMNILSNAIYALDESVNNPELSHLHQTDCASEEEYQPKIWITTKVLRLNQIQICFTDNRCGIPEDIQTRLFDPFFTTKPIEKSTSMGLSISHQIITEKHGGTFEFYSKEGKGSKFILTIPFKQHE